MELDDLALLVDLAQSGSFSKTAERRFVSQSAVSQRVRVLEGELGQRLVERGKGRAGGALTEAGQRTLTAAREILGRVDALRRELAELDGMVAGTLNVATVYSIGLHAITPALTRFLADYPQVNLHLEYLRTDRVYDAIVDGAIDCGIVACPQARPGMEIVPLVDEAMVVIGRPGHPAQVGTTVPARTLTNAAFVAFDPDIPTRRLIDRRLADDGVAVRVVQAFDNIETIKRVVEIGLGVAIVPEPTVRREVRDGTLWARPLAGPPLMRPTGVLLRRSSARGRALERFLDALSDAAPSPQP